MTRAEIDAALREETEIDMMAFLNLVTALGERRGIDIPDPGYDRMQSYNAIVSYLAGRAT